MSLQTKYMGLTLQSPVIVGSSSITSKIENIKKCAEYGAGAIVLKSLFEEQIIADIEAKMEGDDMYFWFPQAADFVKTISSDHGVKEYLKLITEAKKSISIPVIASINCVNDKEWIKFAKEIENAGADALELNISLIPYDVKINCKDIAEMYFDIIKKVKKTVTIPVAVKIGPHFTNLIKFASNLKEAGADGLVTFNRYYSPDIDIDSIELITTNYYSSPTEITNTIRWVNRISEKVKIDISASTGIYNYTGAVKQILAGATSIQLCSTLYKNGLKQIARINKDIEKWMKKKGFTTIDDFKGLIQRDKQNEIHFERVQFMKKTTGKN